MATRRLPGRVGRVLDVGCGASNLLRALADRADAVVGVDPDPGMVATARRRTAHLPQVQVLEDAAEQAAEVARLVSLGAQRVDWDSYPEDPDFVVLADTEGNPFCIVDLGHDG